MNDSTEGFTLNRLILAAGYYEMREKLATASRTKLV